MTIYLPSILTPNILEQTLSFVLVPAMIVLATFALMAFGLGALVAAYWVATPRDGRRSPPPAHSARSGLSVALPPAGEAPRARDGEAISPTSVGCQSDVAITTAWRFQNFVNAGLDIQPALDLAEEPAVDLHEFVDLVGRGCPPMLAAHIVKPLTPTKPTEGIEELNDAALEDRECSTA